MIRSVNLAACAIRSERLSRDLPANCTSVADSDSIWLSGTGPTACSAWWSASELTIVATSPTRLASVTASTLTERARFGSPIW